MILKVTNLGPNILIFTESRLLPYVESTQFVPGQHVEFPPEFTTSSSQLNSWCDSGLVELRMIEGEFDESGTDVGVRQGVKASGVVVEPNNMSLIQSTNVQDFLDNVESILESGGSGSGTKYKVEEFILTAVDVLNKFVTLELQPCGSNITVSVRNGPPQGYNQDYVLSGKNVTWAGRGLEGVVIAGDELIVGYEHSCP